MNQNALISSHEIDLSKVSYLSISITWINPILIDLRMDWFLYDIGLRHERVKSKHFLSVSSVLLTNTGVFKYFSSKVDNMSPCSFS